MHKKEQATTNRRDNGTISRCGFVANAALIGAGVLAVGEELGIGMKVVDK
jgi:hypothetical protein